MAVGLVLLLFETALAEGLEAEVAHQVVRVKFGTHGGDAAAQDGLLACLAHAAARLVVVGLAQRLALVLEEAAVDEGAVALPAHKALRVPQGVEGRDVVLQDWLGASLATGGEEGQEALLAVLLTLAVMETFLSECPAALDATETLRVPILVQGGDHFIEYGLVAVCAVGRVEGKVVRFAVRLTVLFEEVPAAQFCLTLRAHKVFRVPYPPQSSHHLSYNRFLTGRAATLGGCGDSLPG